MTHKLVGFTYSDNLINKQYITNQLLAISEAIPDLQTEWANQHDLRLRRLVKHYDRLPCYLLLKDDAKKAVLHGKMTNDYAIQWTKDHIG